MVEGSFFALEGVDGVGKSTQVTRLADWLRGLGYSVVTCRDPGSTELGEAIREILLHTSASVDRTSEMLLYMAARAQLVREVVRPALEVGKIVVSDRFLVSNLVYQGVAGGLDVSMLHQVGAIATDGILPDLTLLLDLDPEEAERRRGGGDDRMEGQGMEYLRRVRDGFLQLATDRVHRIEVVAAGADPATIHAHIRQCIEPRLPPRDSKG